MLNVVVQGPACCVLCLNQTKTIRPELYLCVVDVTLAFFAFAHTPNANAGTRTLAVQTQQIGSWSNQRGSCQQKAYKHVANKKCSKSTQEVNQRPLESR